jgi:replicative DNA helicase
MANRFFDILNKSSRLNEIATGNAITSGWNFIDKQMGRGGGIPGDRLVILQGRPKTGKTHFITNWIYRLAKQNLRSYFFSAEMSEVDILYRCMALISGLSEGELFDNLTNGTPDIFRYVGNVTSWLEQFLQIDRQTPLTIANIETTMKYHCEHNGYKPDYYFIDHHLLIKPLKANVSQFEKVNEIMEALTVFKRRFFARIVLVVQIGRQGGDGSRLPSLDQGKGSGILEEVLDLAISIARPEIGDCKEEEEGKIKVIVDGNRFGARGEPVFLPYNPTTGEITEVIW